MIAHAQEGAHVEAAKTLLGKIESAILFPLMSLMMGIAVLVFLWGCYEFVMGAGDSEAQTKGKSHIMYGIIGMIVMVSALAILKIAAGTFGVSVSN